jgi:AcrR family transcriptional regulator
MMMKKGTLNRLKQQERQLREDLIIDAARTVFGRKTYDQVSMNEIAKAAGIAKSSIYTYFSNQEALFVETAYRDTRAFIASLRQSVEQECESPISALMDGFLDYSIAHDAHWRMITHFSLHGNIGPASGEKLNQLSIQVIDLLERVLHRIGCRQDNRLLAHTLFAALSGIMISFRKYPGRTEAERVGHMKRIARRVEAMLLAYVAQNETS